MFLWIYGRTGRLFRGSLTPLNESYLTDGYDLLKSVAMQIRNAITAALSCRRSVVGRVSECFTIRLECQTPSQSVVLAQARPALAHRVLGIQRKERRRPSKYIAIGVFRWIYALRRARAGRAFRMTLGCLGTSTLTAYSSAYVKVSSFGRRDKNL